MSKCARCSTDFTGNTCPNCGATYKECPSCHLKVSEDRKACPICGYAFEYDPRSMSFAWEIHDGWKMATLIPIFVSILFSLAMFLFFTAPVAVLSLKDLGELLTGERQQSLFNFYEFIRMTDSSEDFAEFFLLLDDAETLSALNGLHIFSIVMFVFSVLMLFFSGLYFFAYCKKSIVGLNIISAVLLLFSLFFIVTSSIIIATINSFNKEIQLFSAGACPILILIFAIVCLLVNFIGLYWKSRLATRNLKDAET